MEGQVADKLNNVAKYVVSSTLDEPLEWNNSHLVEGEPVAEVTKLKKSARVATS